MPLYPPKKPLGIQPQVIIAINLTELRVENLKRGLVVAYTI